MGSFPQSIVHYLPVTDHDERWGIVCTTAGYQNVPPGSPYPLTQHPDSYSFTRSRGRVLGEYQLLYIVSGQGEFRSASSPAAPVKAGTVVMLFPDEWHTYAPDPETGWEEWWVGFRGENIDRRVAEGFFSPKTPLLHIGHSAGIVSCYQEIIRSAEEERKGFQQLVTGIVLHLLGSVLFKRDNLQYLDNPIVEKINRAREMMRRHIGDNLPPEEIAGGSTSATRGSAVRSAPTWASPRRNTSCNCATTRPGSCSPRPTAPFRRSPPSWDSRTSASFRPSSGSAKRSPPRSTAANTDSDRSRRPLFGKRISAPSVEKGHRRPRGENAREFAAHLAERSRKTAPLRRKGLRSFDCGGSEKSANGLRARLLNVVLRPLSENRCPIPTEVPCGHFWLRLWCQKAVNAIGCNRRAAAD